MRKILYVSGTRADYGLMRQVLFAIRRHPGLKVEVAVCGMHLMSEFGRTIDEIRKDRFRIHKIQAIYRYDNRESMAVFIGEFVLKFTRKVKETRPDILLLLGDRAEVLAAAIVGAYLAIPVFHIHGGDVSSTVDELTRHAVTKLSHIHLVATGMAARRVIKMGEDQWRIHIVGAPGVVSILNEKLPNKKTMAKRYRLDLSRPILLVTQHAVSFEAEDAHRQMVETMEAIMRLKYQSIIIYPNADAGGRDIIRAIERYRKNPFIRIYKSIPHNDYLGLMKIASVMIGNSSSGIIEAPSFHLPVVDIGTRQEGRDRAGNIIHVGYERREIEKAIEKALYNTGFKKRVASSMSPYGDGKAGERIARLLANTVIDKSLLQKKISY